MAAAQTVVNVPIRNTMESTAQRVRRVLAPTGVHGCRWYRIWSTAELYLERSDAVDAAVRGSSYETLTAGTVHTVRIARGEFGISAASPSAVVEITAMTSEGPG